MSHMGRNMVSYSILDHTLGSVLDHICECLDNTSTYMDPHVQLEQ